MNENNNLKEDTKNRNINLFDSNKNEFKNVKNEEYDLKVFLQILTFLII